MPIPKTLRTFVGTSGRSVGVALLAIASLVAYLSFSPALKMLSAQWTYLQSVLGSVAQSPSARVYAFGFSPTLTAVATLLVFVLSCVGVGLLVGNAMRGSRAAVPIAWVCAMAAAVVPTLLIAVVRWPDGAGSIANPTICAAQMVLLAVVWLGTRRTKHLSADGTTTHEGELSTTSASATNAAVARWLFPLIALAVCYALTILISGFSGIFGYDSFSDHLAVPARWLLTGRIERGLPEEIVTFYPGNFELLVRWTLSLGTDRLAFLLSFGSGVAAVWVIFRMSLELGQSRTAATISALAAASLQVMAYQSIVVYSDTYTALCLLLATWIMLVFARDDGRDPRVSAAFGLALGLALGAKYSAGPPAVVLGSAWLYYMWRSSWEISRSNVDFLNWRRFGFHALSMTAGVLPPMAYWYVLNAIDRGNPLYPLSIAGLPGIEIGALLAGAPGPHTAWERLTWVWTEFAHGPGYETGLGPVFATLAVVGAFMVPFLRRRQGSQVMLAWVILVLAAVAWWRTGVLVTRYGLYPLLLTFVFVGEIWTDCASRVLGAIIGAIVTVTMVAVGHEMLGGAAYNEMTFDPVPPVPTVVDELPPSRILNVVGQPSGYYLRGRDQRHRIISPFLIVNVAYIRTLAPDYVLLPEASEAEFVGPLSLELMGRWKKNGQAGTSLWRVPRGR
jgi:hypothetical protein